MRNLGLMIITVALLAPIMSRSVVWTDIHQWSDKYEAQYQAWLKGAHSEMFSQAKLADGRANPYYGIRVDCADLVYSLRAIFAFENQLPYALNNPVDRSGPLITNALTRFDSVEDGIPRLKKFLTWLHGLVSTHAIPRDTFSIPFASVRAGTIILTSKKNHHSWTIKDIDSAGNPSLIFNSTIGRESGLKVQERQSWPNPSWIFEPEVNPTNPNSKLPVYKVGSYAGFRFWKPIEFLTSLETQVPGFSQQQFEVGLKKWKATAIAAIAKTKETPGQIITLLLQDACADFKQRVEAVTEVENYKRNLQRDLAEGKTAAQSTYVREYLGDPNRPQNSRCLIAKAFDEFSTPSRDRRFLDALILARAYYTFSLQKFGAGVFDIESLALFQSFFPFPASSSAEEAKLDINPSDSNFCTVKIPGQGSLSLKEFKQRLFQGKFSSNPNDAVTGRFGYELTQQDLGGKCPAYGYTAKKYNLDTLEKEAMEEVRASSIGD